MNKILGLFFVVAIAFQASTAFPAPEPQVLAYFTSTFNTLQTLAGSVSNNVGDSLENLVSGSIDTLDTLAGTIGSTLIPLSGIPEAVIEAAFDHLNAKGELVEGTLENFLNATNTIRDAVPEMEDLIDRTQAALQNIPPVLAEHIAGPLLKIFRALADGFANPNLSSVVGPILAAFENGSIPLINLANSTAATLFDNFKSFGTQFATAISNFFTTVLPTIVNNPEAATLVQTLGGYFHNVIEANNKILRDLVQAIEVVLKSVANLAISVKDYITNAFSTASQYLINAGNVVLTAIKDRVTNALNQLNGLKDAATTAINRAKNMAGGFTSLLNAFGLQARAVQTELTNWLNSLTTNANNAVTKINDGANAVAAQINATIANAGAQLSGLYTDLTNDIEDAIKSGNAKAIACATTARDAIVLNANLSANAINTCNENAKNTLDSAISTALTGTAAQFDIASTASGKVADCITAYNADKNAIAGATCLASVGLSALRTSTNVAINTFLTTFSAGAQAIATGAQTCANAAIAAAQAQAATTRTAFEQCLAA